MKPFAAALLALCAAAGLAPSAATAGDGSLTRVRGKAACVSVGGRHGCVPVRGVDHFNRIAVSPGGRSVYVSSNGVAAFRRSAGTGRVRQLRGRGGCVRARGARGCGRANGLGGSSVIAVTQDGRNVYVGSARRDSLVVLSRNRRTGALRQLPGVSGCISGRPLAGCRLGRALAGVSALALSRDGRSLYAGTWPATGGGGIAVLRRNPRTGALVQLTGRDGCVTSDGLDGCALGRSISGVSDLALDSAGANLYAAAARDHALATFDLANGVPHQLADAAGCISVDGNGGCTPARTLNTPRRLAASPNGAQLYATAMFSGAVANLARDPATGALTQPPGPLGCIRWQGGLDCAFARFMEEPGDVEVSRDGRNAYVSAFGSIVVMRRNRATGELSQLPGRAGCIGEFPGCTGSSLLPTALTLSQDGRNVYSLAEDTLVIYRRAG